jgi:hypothetical protein
MLELWPSQAFLHPPRQNGPITAEALSNGRFERRNRVHTDSRLDLGRFGNLLDVPYPCLAEAAVLITVDRAWTERNALRLGDGSFQLKPRGAVTPGNAG